MSVLDKHIKFFIGVSSEGSVYLKGVGVDGLESGHHKESKEIRV